MTLPSPCSPTTRRRNSWVPSGAGAAAGRRPARPRAEAVVRRARAKIHGKPQAPRKKTTPPPSAQRKDNPSQSINGMFDLPGTSFVVSRTPPKNEAVPLGTSTRKYQASPSPTAANLQESDKWLRATVALREQITTFVDGVQLSLDQIRERGSRFTQAHRDGAIDFFRDVAGQLQRLATQVHHVVEELSVIDRKEKDQSAAAGQATSTKRKGRR